MSQEAVMAAIKENPGVLQVDLAEKLDLSPTSIQKNIKGLISWGKVRREKVEKHGTRYVRTYALFPV